MWDQPPGHNLLDSGAPNYDVYETKDGQFMAIACLEPHFYKQMLVGLELNEADLPSVFDASSWPQLKKIFGEKFKAKTKSEWSDIFRGTDACVTPVLTIAEAEASLQTSQNHGPQPAPLLSRTPAATTSTPPPSNGEHTVEILQSLGLSNSEIQSVVTPKSKL